jgi:hypothetical protein
MLYHLISERDTAIFRDIAVVLPTCATLIPVMRYAKSEVPIVGPTCGTSMFIKT